MLPAFGASLIAGLLLSTGVSAGPLKAVRQPESLSPVLARDSAFVNIAAVDLGFLKADASLFATTAPGAAGLVDIKVDCIECSTVGTAVISGLKTVKNGGLLGDIVNLVEDVTDLVEALVVGVKVDLSGLSAHILADIKFGAAASFSLPIVTSAVVDAVALDDTVDVSLMVYLDLIFSLSAEIDATVGIDVLLPQGAYIVVDALTGLVLDKNLEGILAQTSNIAVVSGEATLDLAIRARVELGTEVKLLGAAVAFEAAVYVDIADYTAALIKTGDCFIGVTETVSVDLGIEAKLVAELDFLNFGVAVSLVIPQYTAALPSICLPEPSSTGIKGVPGAQSTGAASATGASDPTSSAGGVFAQQTSTASSADPTITTGPTARIPSGRFGNMTTSTVMSTYTSTITSCAQTVVHCPASAQHKTVVTSTVVAYTTVCPVTAQLTATSAPASTTAAIAPVTFTNTVTFVTCPASGATGISVPAGAVPTQTAPLSTSTPFFPFSNATTPAAAVVPPTGVPAPAAPGTPVTSVAVVVPVPVATGAVASTSPTGPSTPQFTGAASRGSVSLVFGAVLTFGAAALML